MLIVYICLCGAAIIADRLARDHDRWAALTDDATAWAHIKEHS